MTDVVLSIRPIYAHRIYRGEKTVEYRKIRPKQTLKSTKYYLYESGTGTITGYFTASHYRRGSRAEIWNLTSHRGGAHLEVYNAYFEPTHVCHAIFILSVHEFEEPAPIQGKPAQNFRYLRPGETYL